jgi:hypothetical protein
MVSISVHSVEQEQSRLCWRHKNKVGSTSAAYSSWTGWCVPWWSIQKCAKQIYTYVLDALSSPSAVFKYHGPPLRRIDLLKKF